MFPVVVTMNLRHSVVLVVLRRKYWSWSLYLLLSICGFISPENWPSGVVGLCTVVLVGRCVPRCILETTSAIGALDWPVGVWFVGVSVPAATFTFHYGTTKHEAQRFSFTAQSDTGRKC
jgi:hypothetical protein